MATNDDWLREKARQKREQAEQARQHEESRQADEDRTRRIFDEQIDALWRELQREVKRQVAVYNEAAGDPNALYVQTFPHSIDIRASDGNQIVLHLNRERQAIRTTRYFSSGSSWRGTHLQGNFSIADDNRLAFGTGSPAEMAQTVLRQLFE